MGNKNKPCDCKDYFELGFCFCETKDNTKDSCDIDDPECNSCDG